MTESLSNFIAEAGGQVVKPFNCSCTKITQFQVTLDCDAHYTYDEVEFLVNTEHMTWNKHPDTDYFLPEKVQFTDQLLEDIGTGTPYNETFEIGCGPKRSGFLQH
ncbi:expressed unknown protein [Seminavis robusta]|uniref:Uncharacterized protein n=1 Tax=Seminavis robusta TaxID=568900 RepID=A0A9N8D9X8_9STRA|nr:expressed unknown protein [Seminavis robusta]|eukprot:Sro50_g029150.1 n/a (105) ;mRNA; r:93221-93535